MARLGDRRLERFAWALATGDTPAGASRFAGYAKGGESTRRANRAEVKTRAAELAPLVPAGAGPDPQSQFMAELVLSVRKNDTPQACAIAARIAKEAFAARDKALAEMGRSEAAVQTWPGPDPMAGFDWRAELAKL